METKTHLVRLPKGADLLEALAEACAGRGIDNASIQVIGALTQAKLGYYLQDAKKYVDHSFEQPLEILSGMGNVSLKDGKPFVHLHLSLSDENCACFGGHAVPGCLIFAAEACITALPGKAHVRVFDQPTGLFLWEKIG